jgi:hypothetical protein
MYLILNGPYITTNNYHWYYRSFDKARYYAISLFTYLQYTHIVTPMWKIPTYTHLAYMAVLNAIIQDLFVFSVEGM